MATSLRTFAILAVVLVSLNARADWILMGESEEHTAFYVDPASKKVVDGLHRVFVRMDGDKPKTDLGFSYLSIVDLYAFDCVGERFQLLSATAYSGRDLTGDRFEVPTRKLGGWRYPKPKTMNAGIMRIACRDQNGSTPGAR